MAIRVGVMRQVSAQLCQRVRVTESSAGGWPGDRVGRVWLRGGDSQCAGSAADCQEGHAAVKEGVVHGSRGVLV
ncbi:MAG: hypothetical protein CW348_00710 [Thermobifida sp.]|nr:hypothetical protein [Thermobifida sp.]